VALNASWKEPSLISFIVKFYRILIGDFPLSVEESFTLSTRGKAAWKRKSRRGGICA
jgi:hypothetical protein